MNKLKTAIMYLLCVCALCLCAGISAINFARAESAASETTLAVNGVGIRVKTDQIDDTGNGVRFGVTMTKAEYEKIATGEIKETGILVIPTDKLGESELTLDTENIQRRTTQNRWKESPDDESKMESYAYLYNIPEKFYNRPISWRGYAIYSDDSIGYSEMVSRSVAEVAVTGKSSSDYEEFEYIRSAIDEFTVASVTYNYGYMESGTEKTVNETVDFAAIGTEGLKDYKLTEPVRADYEGSWNYDFNKVFLGSTVISATSWKYTGNGYKLDTFNTLNNAEDITAVGLDGEKNVFETSDNEGYAVKYANTPFGNGSTGILILDFNGLKFSASDNYLISIKAGTPTKGGLNLRVNYTEYGTSNTYVSWFANGTEATVDIALDTTKSYAKSDTSGNFVLEDITFQGVAQNEYEIYIASIEIRKNAAGTTFETPSYIEGAANVSIPLSASDYVIFANDNGTCFHIETQNRVAGGTNVLFSANYQDVTLNAGDKVIMTLMMYPSETNYTDYTSTIHFYVNDAYSDWSATSGETVTFTYTANGTTALNNVQLRPQNTALDQYGYFNIYVYGLKIVRNVAGATFDAPACFEMANDVTVPLSATNYTVYTQDNGSSFHFESPTNLSSPDNNKMPILTVNYNNISLAQGSKIIITVKQYPVVDGINVPYMHFLLNGDWLNWSDQAEISYTYTVSTATVLSSISIASQKSNAEWAVTFSFDVSIEIIKNAAGTTFETPSYIEGAANVSIPLSASDYVIFANDNGTCFHIEAQNRVAGGTNVLFSANYQDVTLNAGDKVVMTLTMYPSETNYTDYTSTIHFYVNDAYSDWSATSGETVTFTYTASGTTALNNVQLRPQNSGVGQYGYFNVYVYGIEIVRA